MKKGFMYFGVLFFAVLSFFPARSFAADNLGACLRDSQLSRTEREFLKACIVEIEQTQAARPVIKSLKGKYDFRFKFSESPRPSGIYNGEFIILTKKFLEYKNEEERLFKIVCCSGVIVHEMTHAVHHKNGLDLLGPDPTRIARLQDVKLRELHCRIVQLETFAELERKYAQNMISVHASKSDWSEIVEAKIGNGSSLHEANKFAREVIAKHLWKNHRCSVKIGKKRIVLAMAGCWDVSYGASAMDWSSHKEGKQNIHRGYAEKILSLLDAGIDFTWLMKNFPYRNEDNVLVLSQYIEHGDGYGNDYTRLLVSRYLICDGFPMYYEYGYEGQLVRICPITRRFPGRKLPKDGVFVIRFPNGKKQATYYVKNGLMEGHYKEWDVHGRLLFDIPFEKNHPTGQGLITENGNTAKVTFLGNSKFGKQILGRTSL